VGVAQAERGARPPGSRIGDASGLGAPDVELLGRVTGRALAFQSYLIRRAWGVYYAIWAAALVTFFVFPALVNAAYPTLSLLGELLYYALILLVVLLAIWATSWSFGQTFRALQFRRAISQETPRHWHFYLFLGIGLGIFVLVFVIAYLSSFAGLLFLDACLGGLNIWILVAIRDAFSPVPPEGAIAVGTYAISIVGSASALVLTHNQSWFGALWIIAIVGWSFSAVYALYHAPEEMTLESGL
jgi:hypothetical protein